MGAMAIICLVVLVLLFAYDLHSNSDIDFWKRKYREAVENGNEAVQLGKQALEIAQHYQGRVQELEELLDSVLGNPCVEVST